jgi:glutamate transport system permease protein
VSSVLFDVPGPRARARNRLFSGLFGLALLGLAWFVYVKFDQKGPVGGGEVEAADPG